jgi:hypothetical protein
LIHNELFSCLSFLFNNIQTSFISSYWEISCKKWMANNSFKNWKCHLNKKNSWWQKLKMNNIPKKRPFTSALRGTLKLHFWTDCDFHKCIPFQRINQLNKKLISVSCQKSINVQDDQEGFFITCNTAIV